MAQTMYKGQLVETIDVTPTWSGLLPTLLVLLQDANEEGKKTTKKELQRMANAADNFNELLNELKPIVYVLLDEEFKVIDVPMKAVELIQYCNSVFEYERRDADAEEIATLPEALKAFASINYTVSIRLTDEA